jgi:hypothetical protein
MGQLQLGPQGLGPVLEVGLILRTPGHLKKL